jgi:hypothetical protein
VGRVCVRAPFKLDGVPSQLTVSERRIFMSELASYAQDGSLAAPATAPNPVVSEPSTGTRTSSPL